MTLHTSPRLPSKESVQSFAVALSIFSESLDSTLARNDAAVQMSANFLQTEEGYSLFIRKLDPFLFWLKQLGSIFVAGGDASAEAYGSQRKRPRRRIQASSPFAQSPNVGVDLNPNHATAPQDVSSNPSMEGSVNSGSRLGNADSIPADQRGDTQLADGAEDSRLSLNDIGLTTNRLATEGRIRELNSIYLNNAKEQVRWWSAIDCNQVRSSSRILQVATDITNRQRRQQIQHLLLLRILSQEIKKEHELLEDSSVRDEPKGKTKKSSAIDKIYDKCHAGEQTSKIDRKQFGDLMRQGALWMELDPGLVFAFHDYKHTKTVRSSLDQFRQFNRCLQQDNTLKMFANLATLENQLVETYLTVYLCDQTNSLLLCRLSNFLYPSMDRVEVLSKSGQPVLRWGAAGELISIGPIQDGVDDKIVCSLQDQRSLSCFSTLEQYRLEACNQALPTRGFPADDCFYFTQALLCVLRIFPLDQMTYDRFGETGRSLLPHVKALFSRIDLMETAIPRMSEAQSEVVLSAVLSISRFSEGKLCLSSILNFLWQGSFAKQSPHLWYWQHERSRFLTNSSSPKQEDIYVKFTQATTYNLTDARTRSRLATILKQWADTMMIRQDLHQAKASLEKAKSILQNTPLDFQTGIEMKVCEAKMLRYQGHFGASVYMLRQILDDWTSKDWPHNTSYFRTVAEHTYSIVELSEDPSSLVDILKYEILQVSKQQPPGSQSDRRLRLGLAEIELKRGNFEDAERLFCEIYEQLNEPRVTTLRLIQQNYLLHSAIGLARLSHLRKEWPEAVCRWDSALAVLQRHRMEGTFVESTILASRSIAQRQHSGDSLDSPVEDFLLVSEPQYWMLSIGSWFSHVKDQSRELNLSRGKNMVGSQQ